MASQQRFEGPVLEDLLDRVRAEVGPGARIVAANRIRKGGVGGFFAKEHFEVVVDTSPPGASSVPGKGPVDARASADDVPATILDLAEAVNEVERRSGPPDVIDLVDEHAHPEGGGVLDGDGTPGPGLPSTESDAFAAVLERITRSVDAPDAGDDSRDRRAPRATAATPALTPEVHERMAARASNARRAATATAPDRRLQPAVDPDDVAVLTGTAVPPVFRRVARSTDEVIERPETSLRRLGLPARLVPRNVAAHELRPALVENLAQLPPAPLAPDANGVVIAVVGPGTAPVVLARELADEHGLDPDRVVLSTSTPIGDGVPSWLQVNDASTAEERRHSWHRRNHPTIVAVALTPGRGDLEWARDILDHLEPTITWAIVPAGWKSDDVQDWADRLGGVDVLALTRLDETVSPAAVLELGIPVGRLDDRRATPVTWAELLLGRITG